MCYQHMDQENSLIVETKFEKIELILDNIDLLLIIFFCSIQASLEVKSFTRIMLWQNNYIPVPVPILQDPGRLLFW